MARSNMPSRYNPVPTNPALHQRVCHSFLARHRPRLGFDLVDVTLSAEQEMVAKTAREFAEREIAPNARDWDRTEKMDPAIIPKLAEMGFLGAPLPETYGGGGLDNVSYCLIIEEIGRADSSVRGIVSVNTGLVGKTITKWGTDEQKQQWLPKVCSGR